MSCPQLFPNVLKGLIGEICFTMNGLWAAMIGLSVQILAAIAAAIDGPTQLFRKEIGM